MDKLVGTLKLGAKLGPELSPVLAVHRTVEGPLVRNIELHDLHALQCVTYRTDGGFLANTIYSIVYSVECMPAQYSVSHECTLDVDRAVDNSVC